MTGELPIYSERYVGFIDILGFKAIVSNSIGSPEQAESLVRILNSLSEGIRTDLHVAGDDFKAQTFSDCIVISEAATDYNLVHLLWAVSQLQRDLLAEGVLARGGITKGLLHHSDSIVFGPALIAAYQLEKAIARYPRIVADRGTHYDYKRVETKPRFLNAYTRLRYDDDGPIFVDYLAPFRDLSSLSVQDSRNASRCRASIQNLLDEAIYDPSVYAKLRWLAIYWNSVRMSQPPEDRVEPVEFPILENIRKDEAGRD